MFTLPRRYISVFSLLVKENNWHVKRKEGHYNRWVRKSAKNDFHIRHFKSSAPSHISSINIKSWLGRRNRKKRYRMTFTREDFRKSDNFPSDYVRRVYWNIITQSDASLSRRLERPRTYCFLTYSHTKVDG